MIFSFDFHLFNVVHFRTILKKKIVLFVFISNIIRYTNIVFSIRLNILLIVNFSLFFLNLLCIFLHFFHGTVKLILINMKRGSFSI